MGLENLDAHGLLLRDTLNLLREELRQTLGNGPDYDAGYKFGVADCIDLFQQQCVAFGLSPEDLEIANFNLAEEVFKISEARRS